MGELGCVNLHVASAYLKEVVVQLCWDGKEQDSKPQRGLFRRLASLPAMLPRHLLGIFSSHPTSWTFPGEIPASRVLTELPLHMPTQGSLLLLRRLDFMPAINKEFFLQPGLSNHFLLCGAFCEMCLTAVHMGFPTDLLIRLQRNWVSFAPAKESQGHSRKETEHYSSQHPRQGNEYQELGVSSWRSWGGRGEHETALWVNELHVLQVQFSNKHLCVCCSNINTGFEVEEDETATKSFYYQNSLELEPPRFQSRQRKDAGAIAISGELNLKGICPPRL